ncbi:protein containing PilT protein [Candidatus Thiomargarita nelsonii]|uniref:Protein containing PilT protein n=1 Tax=Candidatus Thiomargarita nelsonii TaxID=1003181 RepID=A0A0A6NZ33_9GAMM|nr:protein containing PilT protein [Candidatus Thiomargarita nelsonii]
MIVLDTHVWLWWINQNPKLKTTWLEHIELADQVGVSAISLFEVSWLDRHNRIQLPDPRNEWFDKASQAVDLQEHHSDPQDRIIIATALIHNALLLSADGKFKLYTELEDKLIQ